MKKIIWPGAFIFSIAVIGFAVWSTAIKVHNRHQEELKAVEVQYQTI